MPYVNENHGGIFAGLGGDDKKEALAASKARAAAKAAAKAKALAKAKENNSNYVASESASTTSTVTYVAIAGGILGAAALAFKFLKKKV